MKVAIFLENKDHKTGWAGYVYAQPENIHDGYSYIGDRVDQFGAKVRVYYSETASRHLDTPGGIRKSNLVVLIDEES